MKPILGITMGDPAGIGAEITVKALADPAVYEKCVPVVIGDDAAIRDALRVCRLERIGIHVIREPSEAQGKPGAIDLIDMGFLEPGGWAYKKVQALCGEASFQYVVKGIRLAMEGKLSAVITGPISKEAINLAGRHYSGHTEIFADYTHTKDYGMLLLSPTLRVIHVTTHCSMREACDRIKTDRVAAVIRLADEGLKLLGIEHPRIAVAGLNAHCSENGLFGWEEAREIAPAIELTRKEGIDVEGPVPPDTVFVKCQGGQYDVVVAMYHDQGHIPLKLSGFRMDAKTNTFTSVSGVNCTIGLPIIRASVDHGTAFDRAGEGRANEESLRDAIDVGLAMAVNKFHLKGSTLRGETAP